MPTPVPPTPHRPDGARPTVGPGERRADSPVDDIDDTDDTDPADDDPRLRQGDWDRELLVSRYGAGRADELLALVTGRPAPHRRFGVVSAVLAVLVAIGLTYAVWSYRSASTGTVGATLIRVETDSDTSVLVSWTVSRDPGTTVACDVTATGDDGAVVGSRLAVPISPGTERATQLVTQVRTTRRGLNATVDRCQRIAPTQVATPGPTG